MNARLKVWIRFTHRAHGLRIGFAGRGVIAPGDVVEIAFDHADGSIDVFVPLTKHHTVVVALHASEFKRTDDAPYLRPSTQLDIEKLAEPAAAIA